MSLIVSNLRVFAGMSNLESFLKMLADEKGTDLYLISGATPCVTIEGHLKVLSEASLEPKVIETLANTVMSDEQKAIFEQQMEMNLSLEKGAMGRFRFNIYRQRGEVSMVIRRIAPTIPTRSELKLPVIIEELSLCERGLILVVGATGSGKSTTLASMIQHRSTIQPGHIVTLEDPIEYVHPHAKSLVSQREVGIDTLSYESGLKNALRQAPDVIVVGEVRSSNTMEQALTFAETGHLCISTLHANNAYQALDRIIHFFDESKHQQVLLDLSFNLKGIVSQRLVPSLQGGLRVVTEVLVGTSTIKDYIRQGKIGELRSIIERGENAQMHTFDQDLIRLVKEGTISEEVALKTADSENNLRIELNLGSEKERSSSDTPPFSIKDD